MVNKGLVTAAEKTELLALLDANLTSVNAEIAGTEQKFPHPKDFSNIISFYRSWGWKEAEKSWKATAEEADDSCPQRDSQQVCAYVFIYGHINIDIFQELDLADSVSFHSILN